MFFNNPTIEDGAVRYSGNNRIGEGEGDDEGIKINLSEEPGSVVQIMVFITIHNKEEGFHFGNL